MRRWVLMAIALILLNGLSWESQPQVAREVPCPPQEPNSFCVLRGPLGYNMEGRKLAFSPDGRWLAVYWGPWQGQKGESMIWVWRVADGQLAAELRLGGTEMGEVRFSPDGRLLVSSTARAIRVWEAGTWKEIHTVHFSREEGGPLAFSPSGRMLASAGCLKLDPQQVFCVQPAVILVDPYKGLELKRIVLARRNIITDLAFLSDEILITGLLEDIYIYFWNVSTGRLVKSIFPVLGVERLEISPDGKLLVVMEPNGPILRVWDVSNGQQLGSIRNEGFTDISFSPDGKFLAGSESYSQQERDYKLLQIWRIKQAVKDWQVARILPIPVPPSKPYYLGTLSFSPDGKILAIHIWNAAGVEQFIQLWYVGDLR